MLVNEGFQPKRTGSDRLPPGQYETKGFPVLALGPTPHVDTKDWTLEVGGLVERPMKWTWDEFQKLPMANVVRDIHCVTKWSKFDTKWRGVPIDEIIKIVGLKDNAAFLIAYSHDGYSTNVPLPDVTNGRAMVAVEYDGAPIEPEHGGPARFLVPHLYFWKSAKWLKAIEFVAEDEPGFWETRGYHNYGDPWREQRYTYD